MIHTTVQPPPPMRLRAASQPPTRPVRVGIIVLTFSFGGSETETIELVRGCDPGQVRFTGVAVGRPQALPPGEPPTDGSFPVVFAPPSSALDPADPRVRLVSSFNDAVRRVVAASDVLLSWGVSDLQAVLPPGPLPKLVIVSKDSGDWAHGFGHANALLTPALVANSSKAAVAFPDGARSRVTVIHDGFNPDRVAPRLSRDAQRFTWDLSIDDLVVGYHGRIELDKGVDKIADAVAVLPARWKAVFVGVNPHSRFATALREHCERVIPGRYWLLPWTHDVGSVLAAFDVFCQPSEHEGFSNSLAEAWLAGVPTVYTAGTGALPDVGDLGVPINPGADGPQVAAALVEALGNTALVAAAQSLIRQFTVALHVDQWTRYLTLMHDTPRAVRVLLVGSAEAAAHQDVWREACKKVDAVELCGVVASDGPGDAPVELTYFGDGCPRFSVGNLGQLASVGRHTRPDVVLALPGGHPPRLVADCLRLPVLVTSLRPWTDGNNWSRWLSYFAAGSGVVHR